MSASLVELFIEEGAVVDALCTSLPEGVRAEAFAVLLLREPQKARQVIENHGVVLPERSLVMSEIDNHAPDEQAIRQAAATYDDLAMARLWALPSPPRGSARGT